MNNEKINIKMDVEDFKKAMEIREKWIEESKTETQVEEIRKDSRFYKLIEKTNY